MAGAESADHQKEPGSLFGFRLAPESLFLLFALVGGLILLALIPPLAGGNEEMNLQRSAMIANGHMLVRPAALPGGLADLLDITDRTFTEGKQPPLHYSRAQFDEVATLKLRASEPRIVEPNPIAVLNPVSYLPQAPAIALGEQASFSPLLVFYLGRLAGLIAGIVLTFFAIRIIPVHKFGLAAIALLPPILFSRSTLDADQFTNGLAFLFLALALREIAASGPISQKTIVALALAAFLLAQAKSAYLLLPLLTFALPAQRFASASRKALACAIICLPGIGASAAWMLLLKLTYFTALQYHSWSGLVEPHQQLELVLSHPLNYAATLIKTVFGTAFIAKSLIEFLGVFGPPVQLPFGIIIMLAGLVMATILSGDTMVDPQLKAGRTRALAIGVAVATVLIILTLLYLQWTRFGGPEIDGFNGRYLYPLVPLVLLFIPSAGRKLFRLSSSAWLVALAFVSVAATSGMTWWTYYA